jgi:inner membrane transporter RhtA
MSTAWTSSGRDALKARLPALAAVGTGMISVQIGASLAKRLFPVVGAEGAVLLRVGFAAIVLLAVFRPWRTPPAARDWLVLGAYGLCLGLMNMMFYAALERIPLGLAVGVEFIGPLGIAIALSRRRIDFLWIALAVVGLALLLPIRAQARGADPIGLLLALGAGLGWAGYILSGRLAGAVHGARATALGMTIAALVVAPIGASHLNATMLTAPVLLTGAAVAVLSSVLPYSLEMYAMGQIPPRIFSILMSLEPAIAALMGWLILRETLSMTQGVAIALVMAASLGVALTRSAQEKAPLGASEGDPTP